MKPKSGEGKTTREEAARETRRRLLAGAVTILHRDGPAALTLDALAREISLTKGAVLHHFHTKEALVIAVIGELFERANADIEALAQQLDGERAWSRAFVEFAFERKRTDDFGIALQSLVMSVVGDTGAYPSVMAGVRESLGAWQRRMERDGVPPAAAYIVRLSLDGLADAVHNNVAPPDARTQREMRERLMALVTEGATSVADGGAPVPASVTPRGAPAKPGLATFSGVLALDRRASGFMLYVLGALLIGLLADAYVQLLLPLPLERGALDIPDAVSSIVWPLLIAALGAARFLVRSAWTIGARADARAIELLGLLTLSFPLYGFLPDGEQPRLIGVLCTTLAAMWVALRVRRSSRWAAMLIGALALWLVCCSASLIAAARLAR